MPPININWNIESIRVTAFHRGTFNTRSLETWLETTSENVPTQVNKTAASFSGVSRSPDGFFIRADWNGNRFDVMLTPVQPETVAYLAPFNEARRLFDRFVDSVPHIESLPAVDRIALGVILTASVDDEGQGINLLRPAIHGLQIDPRARDFLYRVNYPSESRNREGVNINRLATWSVGKVQTIQIQLRPNGSQIQETVNEMPTAIRLELDINTDKSIRLEANSEVIAQFLSEMEVVATNIANNGESSMLPQVPADGTLETTRN
jgi:hypothetical protein